MQGEGRAAQDGENKARPARAGRGYAILRGAITESARGARALTLGAGRSCYYFATMDTLSTAQRSALMARVRRQHTAPELAVRKALSANRIRYRLHVRKLPGVPDVVIRTHRTVIFVQGCFWHGHKGCRKLPKSNRRFWAAKIKRNSMRDVTNRKALKVAGWRVLWIWECQTRDLIKLNRRISKLFQ